METIYKFTLFMSSLVERSQMLSDQPRVWATDEIVASVGRVVIAVLVIAVVIAVLYSDATFWPEFVASRHKN